MKRMIVPVLTLIAAALLAGAALAQDVCAPAKVTNLGLKDTGNRTITMKWTEPGDDCNTGDPSTFEVRRSSSNITDTNWQGASVLATGTCVANGSDECLQVSYPTGCPTRYFVVFIFDEASNRSPMSNVFSYAPACSGTHIPVCP